MPWHKLRLLVRLITRLNELEIRMNEQQKQIDNVVAELATVKIALSNTQADITALASGLAMLEAASAELQLQVKTFQAQSPLDLTALFNAADSINTQVGTLKTSADAAVAALPAAAPPVVPATTT